ncbi:cytochrome b-c1 complex subunit Rieske, mitochondrial [Ischnura elegans]|uniref:cytochrome b-c1 complex subunit Rieske, mitochondrial n=1 Tax=Ischnura elegans TaxID=197161 RepID=UPI001ED872DA|nr:cytochrome b-c1 complex subunit Rieske, mitochondrial [Ischnura elegans]
MLSIISKSSNLSPYLKGTTQVVASQLKSAFAPVVTETEKIVVQSGQVLSAHSWNQILPRTSPSVTSGPTVPTQVRYAHSDIQVPDFTKYRRDGVKETHAVAKDSVANRHSFTYLIVGAGAVGSAYAAKAVVTQFVSSMSASADVLALAKIEIKMSDIPEGKSVTFKWRGKPLFIRHRTSSEIETERSVNISTLRDPQHDDDRTKKPEWLVLIGVCTHLGCVPIANAGDFGGYYCPCHGSHYDASGRIRKGPAPLNLEIPPYEFPEENLLIVG